MRQKLMGKHNVTVSNGNQEVGTSLLLFVMEVKGQSRCDTATMSHDNQLRLFNGAHYI